MKLCGIRLAIAIVIALLLPALAAQGCSDPAETASGTKPGSTLTPTSVANTTTLPTPATSQSTTTTQPTPEEMMLGKLTLRDKAAQVLLLTFEGSTLLPATRQLLEENPPGGLLLLGRNIESPSQLAALTSALQQTATAGGSEIGLFIAVDQEGGSVQRIHSGAPTVPAARDLGDNSSPVEARRLAGATAAALLALGVNMNLAPVADVVSDATSFLYSRSYGDNPELVADFAGAVTDAFSQSGLISVVKHFPGHGSASGDTHGEAAISQAGKTEFETVHLPPFEAAFAAGAEGVMLSHIVAAAYDPERPASLSSLIVNELLREQLGFTGLAVADDLEMAAAGIRVDGASADALAEDAGSIGDLAVSALNAGCDLLISTGTLEHQMAMIDAIAEAVQVGRLSESRLDEAVLRILAVKSQYGLVIL